MGLRGADRGLSRGMALGLSRFGDSMSSFIRPMPRGWLGSPGANRQVLPAATDSRQIHIAS